MKRKRILLLSLALLGCGMPTIDTSSETAYYASMHRVRRSLDADAKAAFDESVDAMFLLEMEQKVGVATNPDEAVKSGLMKRLHGKTGEQVIAEGKQILRERKQWEGRMRKAASGGSTGAS